MKQPGSQNHQLIKAVGCIIISTFVQLYANAQDIHFSQFDETPLQLNPANTGVHHDIRIITNYKNQWQSINSPYKTFALSGDVKLLKGKEHQLGLGLDFFNDKAGEANLTSNQANISLSAIININSKSLLSAGLTGGFAQRSLSTNNLIWGNQYNGMTYDAGISSGESGKVNDFKYADLGAGVQYSYGTDQSYISGNNSRKINIGASVFHPHKPSYSFYGDSPQRLNMKIVLHGDAAIGIANSNLILKPSYIVFMQGPLKEITPGMMFQYIIQEGSKYTGFKLPSAFSLGGYYRMKDAFIAIARFEYANYSIGFSYDINLSDLRTITNTRGGMELSLRYISPDAFSKTTRAQF